MTKAELTTQDRGIPGMASIAFKTSALLIVGLSLLLPATLRAQDQQKPDDIPDAPSATRPVPPPDAPSPRPGADQAGQPDASDNTESSSKPASDEMPHSLPDLPPAPNTGQTPPPPMPEVKTVPAGSVPRDKDTGQDAGYIIKTTANIVLVPVTVKDDNGRMVNGLLPADFAVLENGQRQQLKFFTSDPFALSAAVIIDLGMPDEGVRKMQQTLSAMQGAFTPYDEVAIYTYSSTTGRVSDFGT
ncbi:MAG: hypothetical protein WBV46_21860, partial [Terriglobales bacterium]